VQVFAKSLLEGSFIDYEGDPLRDFGSTAFLERFSYRNPKQKDLSMIKQSSNASFSTMQRKDSGKYGHVSTSNPVNSKNFLYQKSVREEEEFFLRFFKEKDRRERSGAKKSNESKEQNQDDGSESEEDEEAGYDRFSQQLAEGLLHEKAGGMSDGEDDDEPMWDFSDDEDNGGSDEEEDFQANESESSDKDEKAGKKNSGKSPFAAAEDFASILEKSGQDSLSKKERSWADEATADGRRKKKRRK